MRRVLIVGWPSFVEGVATAGDVLAMEAAGRRLEAAGVPHDMAWSPVFRPGGLTLDRAEPRRYTHLLFVCGPLHGPDVEELHRRYAHCRRVAVGVSVTDGHAPAAAGFDALIPRDGVNGTGSASRHDLSADVPADRPGVPVVGVVPAPPQPEYGRRGRHDQAAARLLDWLRARDCARVPIDTRLDPREWRLCATAAQLESVIARLDLVVTMRLHGLVLALKNGVPALAIDPIDGGAKVSAQARAWDWPAALTLPLDEAALEREWAWCLSAEGRAAARDRGAAPRASMMDDALGELA
ncbi:MAG TPA: polysaccharide pyruvyl transferase family protein [Streptosporangiaceae bacterium]